MLEENYHEADLCGYSYRALVSWHCSFPFQASSTFGPFLLSHRTASRPSLQVESSSSFRAKEEKKKRSVTTRETFRFSASTLHTRRKTKDAEAIARVQLRELKSRACTTVHRNVRAKSQSCYASWLTNRGAFTGFNNANRSAYSAGSISVIPFVHRASSCNWANLCFEHDGIYGRKFC